MGKSVKNRAKLRWSSSVGVFKKRLFSRNQHVNLKTQKNTAEHRMNRTETRASISTSASKFHKSLRENTNKFGESVNVNVKADNITDMESCFMLLDIDILKSVIEKKGLSLHLNLMCMEEDCDWNKIFLYK